MWTKLFYGLLLDLYVVGRQEEKLCFENETQARRPFQLLLQALFAQ